MSQTTGVQSLPAGPSAIRAWLLVFLATVLLYALTANRTVQWQDSGWQQLRIYSDRIDHPFGLALVHPVQFHLGRLAMRILPVEPALAITLVSSCAAAIAVANLFVLGWRLTNRVDCAALPAAMLALSHTFWQHATHTESYAITSALLTTEWLVLRAFSATGRPAWLVGLFLVNGLGVANHLLSGLATPVNGLVLLAAVRQRRAPAWALSACVAAWLVGSLPYSYLVAARWVETGELLATVKSALVGEFSDGVLSTRLSAFWAAFNAGIVALNFPNPMLPLAAYGLWASRRWLTVELRRVWTAELIIFGVFVFRYGVLDQYLFFFPVYLLATIFAGLGLADALQRLSDRARRFLLTAALALTVTTPAVYGVAYWVAKRGDLLASRMPQRPYRDGYRAFILPWGIGERHADQLNAAAFELAGSDGLVFIVDGMARFALRYHQLRGRGSEDVTLLVSAPPSQPENVARQLELLRMTRLQGRPVVLIPRDRRRPEPAVPGATWQPTGELYVLELDEAESSAPTATQPVNP